MKGDRTRQSILERAVDLASVEGLEGLTIGRLADDLEMSKSGLFAHFGSKEELQLATIRAARAIFSRAVVVPAQAKPAGAAEHASPWDIQTDCRSAVPSKRVEPGLETASGVRPYSRAPVLSTVPPRVIAISWKP